MPLRNLVVLFAALAVWLPLSNSQTTTLAAETANNTSACSAAGAPSHCKAAFSGMTSTSSGTYNAAPGNLSDVNIHTALYPGTNTLVLAHYQPWFCMQAGSTSTGSGTLCNGHVQVGYDSNDSATVNAQMKDMIRRGLNGVVVDWYGPSKTSQDATTLKLRDNLDARCAGSQNCPMLFTLTEDQGAWSAACPFDGNGVDRTNCIAQAMNADLDYMNANYFGSPSYMKVDPLTKQPSATGRPVIMYFICEECFTNPAPNWANIWAQVRAHSQTFQNGNGLFIFRNSGAFQHVETDGGFAWVNHYGSNDPYGLVYLDNFYQTSLSYPRLLPFGGAWKGFDNSNAPWKPAVSLTPQQCGSTWLQTLRRMSESSRYSINNQLPFLQLITWNDYEEGTELETGIDNCLSMTASVSGSVLSWNPTFSSPSGTESTVDRYEVFDSTDGQTLTKKATLLPGSRSVDLNTLTLAAGNHTLFVKAVGAPFVQNRMSNGAAYSIATSSFTMTVSPGSRTINRGQSTTFSVAIAATNMSTPVALSVAGLPGGTTATFNPTSTLSSSTLTVQTSTATPRGSFTLKITGTSGSLVRTATVSLKVK